MVRRWRRARFWCGILSFVMLASPASNQNGVAAPQELQPFLPSAEQTSKLSDKELALSFLAAADMIHNSIGLIHGAWAQFRAAGKEEIFNSVINSVPHVIHLPDGSSKTIVFKRFDDLDRYMVKVRDLHTIYKTEVVRRGFEGVVSNYNANVGRGCSRLWPTTGPVAVEIAEFTFTLRQNDKSFWGAVVRNSVAIALLGGIEGLPGFAPRGFALPLTGQLRAGRIDLKDAHGKCTMSLLPEIPRDVRGGERAH